MTARSESFLAGRDRLLGKLIRSETLARAFGRGNADIGVVVLDRGKVFILPTGYGVVFAGVLLVMLVGSINYNNNLGLAFTFLIGGALLISILHSYRNLAGLGFRAGRVAPVFAQQRAGFSMCVQNGDDRPRYSLLLRTDDGGQVEFDVPAVGHQCPTLERVAERRGRLPLGRLRVESRYPLGMFRAWSYLEPTAACLVYPVPGPRLPLPEAGGMTGEGLQSAGSGSEDFAGLRAYRPGDSPRQVHWKSVARQMDPQTKLFSGVSGAELWLEWDDLAVLGVEARLSQMCRWVLDAEQSGSRYGLNIPGTRVAPSRGGGHRARCLEALALFGQPAVPG